jgi:hypothetical protein
MTRYTVSTIDTKLTMHHKLQAVVDRVNRLVNQGHRDITVEDHVSGYRFHLDSTVPLGTVTYTQLYTLLHTDDWRSK